MVTLALILKQGRKCALCRKSLFKGGKLSVVLDHDHESGRLRAALCYSCNRLIGMIESNYTLMEDALEYVAKTVVRNNEESERGDNQRTDTLAPIQKI